MKKRVTMATLSVFVLVLLAGPASAQVRLGLKLSGGMVYVGGGDVNTGLKGWSDLWRLALTGPGIVLGGGYEPFHLGFDLNAEILIQVSRVFGIGLGSGYIQSAKSSALTITTGSSTYHDTWSPKISAIPILMTFYVTLPSMGGVKVYLDAGAGYYLGKYTDTQHIVFLGELDRSYDASGSGFGFHGGLGLEIPLSPQVSFLIEGRGRYATLSGFKGKISQSSETVNGPLYYYEVNFIGAGFIPLLNISATPPVEGELVRIVREAKVDFSGFSAQAGFFFRF